MRVSCNQCDASYELDLPPATLAKGRNLKFRCTACGNRFVVVRQDGSFTAAARMLEHPQAEGPTVGLLQESSSSPPTIELSAEARTEPPPLPDGAAELPTAAAQAGPLFLRQDGVIYRVEDQATLQRWIVERRIEPTGEISTGAEDWAPLIERPDLRPFFELLDRARPLDAPNAREPEPSIADEPSDSDGLDSILAALADAPDAPNAPAPDAATAVPEPDGPTPPADATPGPPGPAPQAPEADDLRVPRPEATPDPVEAETPGGLPAELMALIAAPPPEEEPEPEPEPPPTEEAAPAQLGQLPADIEALLAGLGPEQESLPPPSDADEDGPAPELAGAVAALPPELQALLNGDLGEADAPTEEVSRRADGTPILSDEASPFDDDALLDASQDASQQIAWAEDDWDEDEGALQRSNRWLGALVIALALGVAGWWWWTGQQPVPEAATVDAAGAEADAEAGAEAPGAAKADGSSTEPQAADGEPPAEADGAAAARQEATPDAPPAAVAPPAKPAKATPPARTKPAAAKKSASPPTSELSALLSRGWKHIDAGRLAAAGEVFARAAATSPQSGQAHYGVGYVADQRGDTDAAYREYCVAWSYAADDVELKREIEGRLRAIKRSCN